jgi:hypothetical protein
VERKSGLPSRTPSSTRAAGASPTGQEPRIGAIVARHGIKSAFDSDKVPKEAKDAVEMGKKALDEGLEKMQEGLRK